MLLIIFLALVTLDFNFLDLDAKMKANINYLRSLVKLFIVVISMGKKVKFEKIISHISFLSHYEFTLDL